MDKFSTNILKIDGIHNWQPQRQLPLDSMVKFYASTTKPRQQMYPVPLGPQFLSFYKKRCPSMSITYKGCVANTYGRGLIEYIQLYSKINLNKFEGLCSGKLQHVSSACKLWTSKSNWRLPFSCCQS